MTDVQMKKDDDNELLDWKKKLIDERLEAIKENPERVPPIEGLYVELDKLIH